MLLYLNFVTMEVILVFSCASSNSNTTLNFKMGYCLKYSPECARILWGCFMKVSTETVTFTLMSSYVKLNVHVEQSRKLFPLIYLNTCKCSVK